MTSAQHHQWTESGTELSVIVVTYDAPELALSCLESLRREIGAAGGEVLVVDNGSSSDLAARMALCFPEFLVTARTSNSGFAAAANLGAGMARGKLLLFLNPDTLVPEGAIEALLAFARSRPHAGIWGGKTLFADGGLNPHSCRRAPSLWGLLSSSLALDTRYPNSRFFGSSHYGGWCRDTERQVEVVCGCYLLIQRDLWERLGGFSPEYFMYGEDDDFCIRARRLGFRPSFTPQSVIVHHGSGSEASQERKICQLLAARAVFIRSHFSVFVRPLALMLLALRPWLGRHMAKPQLQDLWARVWKKRDQWLIGRFG